MLFFQNSFLVDIFCWLLNKLSSFSVALMRCGDCVVIFSGPCC